MKHWTVLEAAKGRSRPCYGWYGLFIILSVAVLVFSLGLGTAVVPARSPAPQPAGKLRVITKPLEPFVIVGEDGSLTGFSIDLWQAIAADLALDYEWIQVETVTEQLQAVQYDQADVAISGISMTPEREQIVDFTHHYFNAGLRILASSQVGDPSALSQVTNFLSPGMLHVLGIGLLTLVVMAHIIWLVERGSSGAMPKAYVPGIWEALWWSLTAIARHQYGDKEKPRNVFKRLLGMFWIVLGIILIAQFTAGITASLTVKHLTGNIGGPEDLNGKRAATVARTTAADYLEENDLPYTPVTDIEEAYPLLIQGQVDAIVYDSPVLIYYAQNRGKGRVEVVGPIFKEESYGIALPIGSTLRKPINGAILDLKRKGKYDELYEKWFGNQR